VFHDTPRAARGSSPFRVLFFYLFHSVSAFHFSEKAAFHSGSFARFRIEDYFSINQVSPAFHDGES
jgi:hypothetical protein